MMKLKVIDVKPYDDYVTVTDVYENMSVVVRLDKLGLTEESRTNND